MTGTQTECLLMMCCGGYTPHEIALLTKRSKGYIRQIFEKIYKETGMSNKGELVAWFYRHVQ